MRDLVTSPERAAAFRAAGHWTADRIGDRVRTHAAEAGDRVAVVDRLGARTRTFGDLLADGTALAERLADLGVAPGGVVSVQLPNGYEAVVAFVATQLCGAVVNPLLPNYRANELAQVFAIARPAVVVTPTTYRHFDHEALVADVAARTGLAVTHLAVDVAVEHPTTTVLEHDGSRAESPPAAGVSEVIFTSGTEARPKAILHSEETCGFSVRAAYDHLGMGPDDVVWMPSPVGHSTGLNYGVRLALHHGLRLVLQDVWDGAEAVRLIAEQEATYTLSATTFLKDVTEAARSAGVTLPTMKRFGCGGAPVPAELVQAAAAQGIGALRLYGSTEVLVASWHRPGGDPERLAASDGEPLPDIEVRVVADDGTEVGEGEPGELQVRGPNTCLGYFDDPERTAATFLDGGWVRSGDLVERNAHGDVAVVGRKKEIIIRGGMNIAPREIEDLLLTLAPVRAVAVVGLPDERLGERCCACLVLDDGAELAFDDMVAQLKDLGLATYKLPQQLVVVDALPMTPSGKVQKHVLVQQVAPTATPT